jgi:hypothetical protein
MRLLDGRQPKVTQIATGGTSGIQKTPEQKAAISAKMSAASKQRYAADPGSEHWKEAAAIHEVMSKFLAAHSEFEWHPLPDNLGADLVIRRKGDDDAWTAVQMKSAIAHPGEDVSLHVKKKDGKKGGKYEVSVAIVYLLYHHTLILSAYHALTYYTQHTKADSRGWVQCSGTHYYQGFICL